MRIVCRSISRTLSPCQRILLIMSVAALVFLGIKSANAETIASVTEETENIPDTVHFTEALKAAADSGLAKLQASTHDPGIKTGLDKTIVLLPPENSAQKRLHDYLMELLTRQGYIIDDHSLTVRKIYDTLPDSDVPSREEQLAGKPILWAGVTRAEWSPGFCEVEVNLRVLELRDSRDSGLKTVATRKSILEKGMSGVRSIETASSGETESAEETVTKIYSKGHTEGIASEIHEGADF